MSEPGSQIFVPEGFMTCAERAETGERARSRRVSFKTVQVSDFNIQFNLNN